MPFDKFDRLPEELPGTPGCTQTKFRDWNPITGRFKIRTLTMPNEAMAELQRRLLRYIRWHVPKMFSAVGARPGGSPRQAIQPHRRNRYLYIIDLEDAYGSVDGEKLAQLLCARVPELALRFEEVLDFLKCFCLTRCGSGYGGLATGLNASQDLFNLYLAALIDEPLAEPCLKHQLTYTRYVDDLVFSSENPIGEKKRRAIRQVILAEGLKINHQKTQVLNLGVRPVNLFGIGLELGGRLFLPRGYTGALCGLIHRGIKARSEVIFRKTAGMMGCFWSTTKGRRLNQTEARLVAAFEKYRRLCQLGVLR